MLSFKKSGYSITQIHFFSLVYFYMFMLMFAIGIVNKNHVHVSTMNRF